MYLKTFLRFDFSSGAERHSTTHDTNKRTAAGVTELASYIKARDNTTAKQVAATQRVSTTPFQEMPSSFKPAHKLLHRVVFHQTEMNHLTLRGFCSDRFPSKLTHLDDEGKARMVDVGGKSQTKREAVAKCQVRLGARVFEAIRKSEIRKGNALEVARIAGINAAKQTSFLIPLCHNIPLSSVSVDFEMDEPRHTVTVIGKASSLGQTGVEMEALVAVTLAALTIYDMCKAISHHIVIDDVKLVSKVGGKSDFSKR